MVRRSGAADLVRSREVITTENYRSAKFKTLIELVLMKGSERLVMEEYPKRRDPYSVPSYLITQHCLLFLTCKYSLCAYSCYYLIQFRLFTLLNFSKLSQNGGPRHAKYIYIIYIHTCQ